MKKVARILSIDGGGIRGLIPSTIILDWEKMLGPIASHFHMLSGTSTGGILATALSQGVSAEKLVGSH
jgi:patatin-like phospholipase/acyl hydrolase